MRVITVLLALLVSGCGMNKAMDGAVDIGRSVAVALVEKANLEHFTANAEGEVDDPRWTAEVYYVQGIRVEIGVDGIVVSGKISGMGTGDDKPLSDEALETIRTQLGSDITDAVWNDLVKLLKAEGP